MMLSRRGLLLAATAAVPAMTLFRSADAGAQILTRDTPAGPAASGGFADFPKTFKGPLIRRGDADYQQVKRLWNARFDARRPALIVRAQDANDVRTAVRYAIRKNIGVAVRSGGHGIECFAMPQDALVIDTSLMQGIRVDPASGRIVVQAGVKLGTLAEVAERHGLVVPAGTVGTVGVSGLTLGGGIGHLTRRFGVTLDSLLAVDVVTMDGRMLTASQEQNADLFWGMRGAGQNLAIATAFTFQGRKIEGVVNRQLLYAPQDAEAVLVALDAVMDASPRTLSITPIVQRAAPMPGMPAELVGKPIVVATVVYTGPVETFETAMAAVRRLPKPMAEIPGPTTWRDVARSIDKWMPAGRRWHNGGAYLRSLSPDIARIAIENIAVAPEGCEVHFPAMGGALFDYREDAMAFSRQDAKWMYEITAQWDAPSRDGDYTGWLDRFDRQLAVHALPNGCINLNSYHGDESVAPLYGAPEKWQRIVGLKRTWDGHNRLCYNRNIRPDLKS